MKKFFTVFLILSLLITCSFVNISAIEADIFTSMPTIKFIGGNISLKDNIAINFLVDATFLIDNTYEAIYLVCEFNNQKFTLTNYTEKDEHISFQFKEISPDKMNDTVTATVYGKNGNKIYQFETVSYSVVQYIKNALPDYKNEFSTLLVDILNYGAATQEYTGYNINNLANSWLNDEQKNYCTQNEREFTSVLDTEYVINSNSTAK